MRRVGALVVCFVIGGCGESSEETSFSSGGSSSAGVSGSGGSRAGAGGSMAGSTSGGTAGVSGAAGQGAASGSSPTGGSGGNAGSSPGGAGGVAGGAGGPMCPEEEPPPPPFECSIGQSVLRCRYERPNPDDPSETCSVTYLCQCVSDHMGGADCSWLGGSLDCSS